MRVNTVEIRGGMKAVVAEYSSPADFAKQVRNIKYNYGRNTDNKWAGGSQADFYNGCELGNAKYAKIADKHVDEFANLAIKDYDRTLDYNMHMGTLDYAAAMAGDPLCMYGSTIEEVDTAPIHIVLDTWTSWAIPTREMEIRGIAVLALVQALSIYRPVKLSVVTGTSHIPSRTNVIQIVDIPTAPMDTGRASWMIASPLFFRRGLLPMTWELAKDNRPCGIPPLYDDRWQETKMGQWIAERHDIKEVVHLPLMRYSSERWKTLDSALAWVKQQVHKHVT